MDDVGHKSQAQYNLEIHRSKGLGSWRALYLSVLQELRPESVIEIGAGAPDFLRAVPANRKVAVDAGGRWAADFQASGIELIEMDLDHDSFPDLAGFDVAVCSNVFEHLLFPDRTLDFIRHTLREDGLLISHVPNEFVLRKTLKVMLGLSDSMYFHKHCDEFSDPHLHRFTKIGYLRFLRRAFKHNLFISDIKYEGVARFLSRLRVPVPYALEGGPTFISTNSESCHTELKDMKRKLSRRHRATLSADAAH